MFEHSNFAEANAININPGPRLLMFEYSNFAEANVNHIMFPLYQLGFTPLWNSYRIGLLLPFKTNNSARFLYRIAFTTQRFWKWYKIYRIGFTAAWNTRRSIMEQFNWLIFCKVWIYNSKNREYIQNS